MHKELSLSERALLKIKPRELPSETLVWRVTCNGNPYTFLRGERYVIFNDKRGAFGIVRSDRNNRTEFSKHKYVSIEHAQDAIIYMYERTKQQT